MWAVAPGPMWCGATINRRLCGQGDTRDLTDVVRALEGDWGHGLNGVGAEARIVRAEY
jgi:hypothetical protein